MKIKRQSKILEIIKNDEIETQEELLEKLEKAGFIVTQATISRDIRDLKLTKITTSKGKQKYSAMVSTDTDYLDKHNRIFKDAVTNMDYAQNFVVIKTLNGMAMAVAAALDAMDKPEIIGTIAGDDTLFCILKTEKLAIDLINSLNDVINKL